VTENGGTLLMPPGDVGPLGRMAVAADPSGAPFGIWQAGTMIGAGIATEPGGLVWEDLRSTDPDAAREFYRAVFGYQTAGLEMAGPDYHTFFRPGEEQAPLGGMGGLFGAEGPSRWLVYFGTASTDAAAAAAERLGGRVLSPPFDSPYGRMASLADPAGAAFEVIETAGNPQPER
jgi:predicted enzyme related to lactoylglutathione lyase